MKSILTKYEDISVFSGLPKQADHHLIFGYGKRDLSERYGLKIPLRHAEHNLSCRGTIEQIHGNPAAERLSKICGQLAFEKEWYRQLIIKCDDDPAREDFRKIFGECYL